MKLLSILLTLAFLYMVVGCSDDSKGPAPVQKDDYQKQAKRPPGK